jgi:hypothetical protein
MQGLRTHALAREKCGQPGSKTGCYKVLSHNSLLFSYTIDAASGPFVKPRLQSHNETPRTISISLKADEPTNMNP